VRPEADQAEAPKLAPWRPPDGGYERVIKATAWERRRRPLTRRQIIVNRAAFVAVNTFWIVVFSLGVPTASLLWHEALAVAISQVVGLVGFSPYQLRQLLGMRPPADKAP
jgi:hypothetical protein